MNFRPEHVNAEVEVVVTVDANVGAAALGCPVERSSNSSCPPLTRRLSFRRRSFGLRDLLLPAAQQPVGELHDEKI